MHSIFSQMLASGHRRHVQRVTARQKRKTKIQVQGTVGEVQQEAESQYVRSRFTPGKGDLQLRIILRVEGFLVPLFSHLFQPNFFPEILAGDSYMVAKFPISSASHFGNNFLCNRVEIRCTGKPYSKVYKYPVVRICTMCYFARHAVNLELPVYLCLSDAAEASQSR